MAVSSKRANRIKFPQNKSHETCWGNLSRKCSTFEGIYQAKFIDSRFILLILKSECCAS